MNIPFAAMVTMSPAEFERLVSEALDSLPEQFARSLNNVVVVIDDEPSEDDLDLAEDGHELLGIFRVTPPLPDQVAIFRKPILRVARNRRDAVRQIRETVIHELGHYFGLHDDEMIY